MCHRNIRVQHGRQEYYSENFVKDVMTMYERILVCPHWPISLWNKRREVAR